jgi:hypothetical protein
MTNAINVYNGGVSTRILADQEKSTSVLYKQSKAMDSLADIMHALSFPNMRNAFVVRSLLKHP